MPKPPPSPLQDPTWASGGSCDASVVTDTLGYLIRRVHDQAIRAFYESHGDVDLGPIAYATLAVVERNPGVRQGVVALELGLQESNMASMVKDLMQKRLLLRTRSEEDGRAYGLTLTKGGRRLIGDMLARAGDLDRRQARNLSGEEREILLMLLRKMLQPDEASTDRPGAGTPPPQAS